MLLYKYHVLLNLKIRLKNALFEYLNLEIYAKFPNEESYSFQLFNNPWESLVCKFLYHSFWINNLASTIPGLQCLKGQTFD